MSGTEIGDDDHVGVGADKWDQPVSERNKKEKGAKGYWAGWATRAGTMPGLCWAGPG